MNRIRWYGPTIVLLVTTLLVMLGGPPMVRHLAWAQQQTEIELVQNRLVDDVSLAKLSQAFRQVGQVVEPSVVHIERYSRAPRGGQNELDMLRERFFGPFGPQQQAPPQQQPGNPQQYQQYDLPQPDGNGSGWVFDNEGHIVTNNHVVQGADRIVARFADGSEREAEVVGFDIKTDIAVVKVKGGNLHPATVAAEPVEKGDIVFAFGSPLRFEFTMSQGIVSAMGRRLHIVAAGEGYENFIQTDAAINPGNSGGPLTNIYGQVVGMNTAIASRTGGYNGLGFAIPATMVKAVVEQLLENGRVSRGYLGIAIEDLDPRMARTFGFAGSGVLVRFPMDGTPAQAAGIKRGDIITSVNGTPVRNVEELRSTIANLPPGQSVKLNVYRAEPGKDAQTLELDVKLAEQPDEAASAGPNRQNLPNGDGENLGDQDMELLFQLGMMKVSPLNEQLARQLGMEDYIPGVRVIDVRPNSAAATAGIRPNMVITHVMGDAVESAADLVNALKKHDVKEGVRLSVVERGQPRFVLLEMPSF